MADRSVRLHRVLKSSPERVYRAFLDPDAVVKWLAPHGFTCKVNKINATVGGTASMSFKKFTTGRSHSFGGEYIELVPAKRIRHTDRFDDPNAPGIMETTVLPEEVFCGTQLSIVQTGLPEAIPLEACYLGWQESLELLAKLVEAEIKEG